MVVSAMHCWEFLYFVFLFVVSVLALLTCLAASGELLLWERTPQQTLRCFRNCGKCSQ